MTCQATYGNGVMIGMTEIITAIRLQATRLDQHQVLNAYAVVVAGTMTQDHTVSRTEVATRRHPQIDTLDFALPYSFYTSYSVTNLVLRIIIVLNDFSDFKVLQW